MSRAERGITKPGPHPVIRASEIGEYIYCHRAWWLGRVKGIENANRTQMESGVTRHHAHGRLVERSELLQKAGLAFLVLALGIGLVLIALGLGLIR